MYPGKYVYVYFILYMSWGSCNEELYFDFKKITVFSTNLSYFDITLRKVK